METTKLSDEWQTPEWLFDELNKEFNFGIDLCATKENSKCERYCTDYLQSTVWQYLPKVSCINAVSHVSGLELQYNRSCIDSNSAAFMNPPYSNPKPFIQKAWEDSKHCKIVCLVKCDPSTRWWATFWNYKFKDYLKDGRPSVYDEKIGPKPGCEVRFFPKRIKFDPPLNSDICTCRENHGYAFYIGSIRSCISCKKRLVHGPTFPSALLIFDRRQI